MNDVSMTVPMKPCVSEHYKTYVALAGIDLSAAFDVVDVELLIKRLTLLGLPKDVIKLIKIWLTERYL